MIRPYSLPLCAALLLFEAVLCLPLQRALAYDGGVDEIVRRLPRKPRVALVLSGGGLKGIAHLGVLQVLDSAQIPIDLIVGTSIGAVVGGLYAVGYSPQQLIGIMRSTDWNSVLDLQDDARRADQQVGQKEEQRELLSLRFTGFFHPVLPQAVSSGQRLTLLLTRLVMHAPSGVPYDFLRDTRVPFVAVTTDLLRGKEKLLTEGNLTSALRASATLPLRFSPLPVDSSILVDGGLIANIPVSVARELGADQVIVSNTIAGLRSRGDIQTVLDVADQVVTLMMMQSSAAELQNANVIITPKLEEIGSTDMTTLDAAVESGKQAARAMLPKLLAYKQEQQRVAPSQPDTFRKPISPVGAATSRLQTLSAILNEATDWEEAIDTTLQWYRSHGFALARVTGHREIGGGSDIYIDEGMLGGVRIVGLEEIDTALALRLLSVTGGEVFQADRIESGLRNLVSSGVFEVVGFEIDRSQTESGARPILVVRVTQKTPNVLRFAALADNEFGGQFSVQFANENLFQAATTLSLQGTIGPRSREASIVIDAPNFFTAFATSRFMAYTGFRDISTYSNELRDGKIERSITDNVREVRDFGVQLRFGGQVGKVAALFVQYRYEKQRAISLQSKIELDNDRVSAIKAEAIYDSRDDDLYPSEGSLAALSIESGAEIFGGTTPFTKLYGRALQTISLSSLHKLIPSLTLGVADLTLPRLEQFSLGGIGSFYGLNAYELRGRQLVHASLTYQISIPRVLFFPTFVSFGYDLGATWLEPAEIKFEALSHGIGGQVGVETPFGVAQFGIGEHFRFERGGRHNLDLNAPVFYFSVGAKL